MQEYNIPSILDEPIALGAIVPNPQNAQLKALISQMVAEEVGRQLGEKDAEIDRLQSKIEELETQLEKHQTNTGRERAFDRKRISKLETRKQQTGPKSREQISELMNYLQDCPNHITPLEGARHHLGVSKNRLSNLLASPDAENQFLLIKNPNDKRKRLIKLRPQI